MQPKHLKMALSIVLAWLPALFWLVFAVTGIVLGTIGLFSTGPLGGLIFIALGVGGILGFVGLSIVCWTDKPLTPTLTAFLACGVLSLAVATGYLTLAGSFRDIADSETLLKTTYFVICPLVYGAYKILSYFRGPGAVRT